MSEKKRYCVCRSTDSKSFMIACDQCSEWFHGKCIKITPDEASNIKRYYCQECRDEEPSLHIKYKKVKDKHSKHRDEPSSKKSQMGKHSTSLRQCMDCESCAKTEDCGKCDFCKDMRKFGGANKLRQKCRQRQCRQLGIKPDDDRFLKTEPSKPISTPAPAKTTAKPPPSPPAPVQKKRGRKPKGWKEMMARQEAHLHSKRNKHVENRVSRSHARNAPRQCFGPRCVNPTRPGSKYCSDDCGMKLGAMRLVEMMPGRIAQWQSKPCVAEQRNKKELEEIKEKILEAKRHLESLDEKHKMLDKMVERGKKEKVKQEDSDAESNSEEEDEEEDLELFVYCVTCGHEVRQRNAFKHMEKCFIKIERDMSFAGSFKSMIGGDTICDHYNAATKSYCKRLKVICAEHAKDPKVADDEICGCPLSNDVFNDSTELCKAAKKSCVNHFRWERLRRAEIDADKVRQWMKIDECFEKERHIRAAMTNRAGLMSLLLHQTVDHDALQRMHTPVKPEHKQASVKPANISVHPKLLVFEEDKTDQLDDTIVPSTIASLSPPQLTTNTPTPVDDSIAPPVLAAPPSSTTPPASAAPPSSTTPPASAAPPASTTPPASTAPSASAASPASTAPSASAASPASTAPSASAAPTAQRIIVPTNVQTHPMVRVLTGVTSQSAAPKPFSQRSLMTSTIRPANSSISSATIRVALPKPQQSVTLNTLHLQTTSVRAGSVTKSPKTSSHPTILPRDSHTSTTKMLIRSNSNVQANPVAGDKRPITVVTLRPGSAQDAPSPMQVVDTSKRCKLETQLSTPGTPSAEHDYFSRVPK